MTEPGSIPPALNVRGDDGEPPVRLMTPAEVALLFGVGSKTVTRWARAGKIHAVRTLGGHRRFRADEITRLLEDADQAAT